MENKTIIVNNILISYQYYVGDSQQTLLFLHGWWRSKQDWDLYLPEIENRNISYIAVDFPGFWSSQTPREIWGVKEYSESIDSFLKKLHISSPIKIIAHSFWGRIAFYLAAQYPEIYTKLVLIAPGWVEKILSNQKKYFLNSAKKLFSLPGMKNIKNFLTQKIWSADYKNAWAMKDIFVKVVNEDLSDIFPYIKVPVQIHRWERDDQIEKRQIEKMREKIPNVESIHYANATHDLHKEYYQDILLHIFQN